jgi:copper chaperone CopZ
MESFELHIDGMICQHCIADLRHIIHEVSGIDIQSVSIGKAIVSCRLENFPYRSLQKEIEDAGYKLVAIHESLSR